jgi:hypothetical protein
MEYKDLKKTFDSLYSDQMDKEELITKLKNAGFSQSQTTMLLSKELKIKFFEADSLVLNSKAWRELKDLNLQARNEIIDALDEDDSNR